MDQVLQWMHATSSANALSIRNSNAVKLYKGKSVEYDGILVESTSPRGVWFHANYYQGRLLTRSAYPEKCTDRTVKGIVFNVADLLRGNKWKMYWISDLQRKTRQVKVAFVVENSPEDCWLIQNNCKEAVVDNGVVKFDQASNTYRALEYVPGPDACMVSVFYCPMHGKNIPYGLRVGKIRELDKITFPTTDTSSGKLPMGHLQMILIIIEFDRIEDEDEDEVEQMLRGLRL